MMDPDNRAHPRFDVLAQVQVTRHSEVYIMSTRNISRGGIFIQGDPQEYPELKVGTQVELVIFNPDDPGQNDVTLTAMVVRRERGREAMAGFGLQFLNIGKVASTLERMLGAM
jgi:hypothetical protein